MISSIHLSFGFGVLGNAVSFLVFLSPLPTFYKIYKTKSTQDFQPLPYAVALFSCMLTLYYGVVKADSRTLLITINTVSILLETSYLTIFIIYAPKQTKVKTLWLILALNVGILGVVILLVSLLTHGSARENIMGWICGICAVCFFASPLCVIGRVIRTKSVEFMPFWLSLSLTVSATMWFFFGFFTWNFFIAVPNVLGLAFGITQLTLHCIYAKKGVIFDDRTPKDESENAV